MDAERPFGPESTIKSYLMVGAGGARRCGQTDPAGGFYTGSDA